MRGKAIEVEVEASEEEDLEEEASGAGRGVTHSDLTLRGMIPPEPKLKEMKLRELVISPEEVEDLEAEGLEEEVEAGEEVLEAEEGHLMCRLDLSKMSRHSLGL